MGATGLLVQVRDGDDARAGAEVGAITGASPDGVGMRMFSTPERNACAAPPSTMAELEPVGTEAEGWVKRE
jgi:hypothetical protein